jgi:hypothetical protein
MCMARISGAGPGTCSLPLNKRMSVALDKNPQHEGVLSWFPRRSVSLREHTSGKKRSHFTVSRSKI